MMNNNFKECLYSFLSSIIFQLNNCHIWGYFYMLNAQNPNPITTLIYPHAPFPFPFSLISNYYMRPA
ncbi:MAG: hypothetical protein EXX96DRAFT_549442 [Benjaminiella poitrasii]|nr:MAG: hypothetical protein EXX96DRAFT_549442 [Benjaminiella poitrasii]